MTFRNRIAQHLQSFNDNFIRTKPEKKRVFFFDPNGLTVTIRSVSGRPVRYFISNYIRTDATRSGKFLKKKKRNLT